MSKQGNQIPTFTHCENYTKTEGGYAADISRSYDLVPHPWQETVLNDWLAVDDNGILIHSFCCLLVPRQNGKTGVSDPRETWGLVKRGEWILHTAQEFQTAKKAFDRLRRKFGTRRNDPYAEYPELNALVDRYTVSAGQMVLDLKNGGHIEFRTRGNNSDMGRGGTFDVVVIDEAQSYTEAQDAAREFIREQYGDKYCPAEPRIYKAKANAQDAHEAIRPTYMDQQQIEGNQQERRLYDLIWKRTIASQIADAEMERTQVVISIDGKEETFQADGEIIKFDGFLRVYNDTHNDNYSEGDNDNENLSTLPVMKLGDSLDREQIIATQRFSQRPIRYNEASLVRKLEELGIGRPSTYATTITTIQQREYVEKGDNPGQERN